MTAARSLRRSGITLTEILIAILIMGVGLISLATLFPLGLIRLREATRQGRAGMTFETAADDMDVRQLLFKPTFRNTWYGTRDPFVQDLDINGHYDNGNGGTGAISSGNFQLPINNITYNAGDNYTLQPFANALPICYDPLWRSVTGIAPLLPAPPAVATIGTLGDTTLYSQSSYFSPIAGTPFQEARFGSGVFGGATPYIQADPDTKYPLASAHGLQRLTNFIPWNTNLLTPQYIFTCTNFGLDPSAQPPDVAGNIFTSVDDIVFNPTGGAANAPSSILPDLTTGAAQADYRFSWFFTGRQLDPNGNSAQFIGDVVVCDGRPFGFDPLPGSTNLFAPAGETVVEAVYGYGGNSRAVQLRWRDTLADPAIRVGGWICDTTYERYVPAYRARVGNTANSFARCNWYQVAKRVDATIDPTFPGYRSTVITLASPVRFVTAQTAQNNSFVPVHLNVALIMPSVINVFPRTFEVH